MKQKIKILGNTGMILVLIGLTGLVAAHPSWYRFYLFVLVVAAVLLVIANLLLTDLNKADK